MTLLQKDLSLNEVARQVGCHASSVMRWRNLVEDFGTEGLKAKAPPGRPPRLTEEQKEQLAADLLRGPSAFGYRTRTWTTRSVAELIKARFAVTYHPDHVGKMLHALGFRHQRPERMTIGRSEAPVAVRKRAEPPKGEARFLGWLRA